MPPRALVFDIGEVLVHWDPARIYRERWDREPTGHPLWPRLMEINVEGDLGSLREAVEAAARDRPADADDIRPFWDRWDEMFGPEVDGTAEILHAARDEGLTIAALSNFANDTFERGLSKFDVLGAFDVPVISGREGLAKPDPAIYALVEERTGFSGADLFFVDDKPENVAAAEARGWHAHRFTEATAFREALAKAELDL